VRNAGYFLFPFYANKSMPTFTILSTALAAATAFLIASAILAMSFLFIY
jgi:hypothetical protein